MKEAILWFHSGPEVGLGLNHDSEKIGKGAMGHRSLLVARG